MTYTYDFRCEACSAEFGANDLVYVCPVCRAAAQDHAMPQTITTVHAMIAQALENAADANEKICQN